VIAGCSAVRSLKPSRYVLAFLGPGFTLLFLLILEGIARVSGVADHLYTEPAFEASPGGSYWRYRTGFQGSLLGPTRVRIGSLGSRLHGSEKDFPGKAPVVIFGDSITFGQGVEEHRTFAALLEKWLLESGFSTRVINFGVAGHSLEMELDHLADRLGDVSPSVVLLAFHTDDLEPKRAENHVDRFGYLTKNVFGSPSYSMDLLRAVLRNSHLALMIKDAILRIQKSRAGNAPAPGTIDIPASLLVRFRSAIERFGLLTPNLKKIILCVDIRDTLLTGKIREIMQTEFAQFTYVHGPGGFHGLPLSGLTIPRDGHPNAAAHVIYGELVWPFLRAAAEVRN